MKYYIWTVKNKKSTKFGWKFDVYVYRLVKNVPMLIGTKENINSGAMMGERSEALSVLIKEGLVPEKYVKKHGGYAHTEALEKEVGIKFMEV